MKNKAGNILFYAIIILAAGWGIRWGIRKTVVPKMEFQSSELLFSDNNKKISINDLKGNVVIVSFFQTWCGSCIQEMYVFDELVTKINSPKLSILCVSDESNELINTLKNRYVPGNILFTHSTKSLASLGVYVFPTTYLLNKKGEVIKSKLEGYNWALEKETIEKLLGE